MAAGAGVAVWRNGRDKSVWDAVADAAAPPQWNDDVKTMCEALAIQRTVLIVNAHPDTVSGPAQMHGRRWPVVVFNGDFVEGLPPNQRRAIIAHELAHLRRYDRMRRALAGVATGVVGGVALWLAFDVSIFYGLIILGLPFALFAAHRHCEFGADRLAVAATGDFQAVIDSVWAADKFEAQRRGRTPTPRVKASRWDANDLLAPHPEPARRERAIERYNQAHQ